MLRILTQTIKSKDSHIEDSHIGHAVWDRGFFSKFFFETLWKVFVYLKQIFKIVVPMGIPLTPLCASILP